MVENDHCADVIDVAIPVDRNIRIKGHEIIEAYQGLITQLEQMWKKKSTAARVVIQALDA